LANEPDAIAVTTLPSLFLKGISNSLLSDSFTRPSGLKPLMIVALSAAYVKSSAVQGFSSKISFAELDFG